MRKHRQMQEGATRFMCFVDFGFSGDPGARSEGCTWEFASFERLLSDKTSTLCPIDDYEALFLCALFQIDPNLLPRPRQLISKSRKDHLRAKLDFMGSIPGLATKPNQRDYLRWVCQKLMLVWQHPRDQRVDEDLFSQLANPALVPFDLEDLRAKVLAKFMTFCDLENDKANNPDKHALAVMLKEALEKCEGVKTCTWNSGIVHHPDNRTTDPVKYDSLFVLKGSLPQNPSLWLDTAEVRPVRFPTLTTLAGQVVYAESGASQKGVMTIWHFVDNYLKMRPLEYLLLFAGIHVNVQGFAPMGNDSFSADAQCLELVSNDKSSSSGWKQLLSAELLKANNDDQKQALGTEIERARNTIYPCVGLATLIVAGRFFVENWRGRQAQSFQSASSTNGDKEQGDKLQPGDGSNASETQNQLSDPEVFSSTYQAGQLAELDAVQLQLDEGLKKIAEVQAELDWAMSQINQRVWFVLDGVLQCSNLTLASRIADLGEGLRVFTPQQDPTKDPPPSSLPHSPNIESRTAVSVQTPTTIDLKKERERVLIV